MDFSAFVKKAIEQDDQNEFSKYIGEICNVPELFQLFYSKNNPVDVEVEINGNSVVFYPYEQLEDLQKDYKLGEDCFAFATCNGDPVYLKNDAVFSCVFGKNGAIEDKLADSLQDFLDSVD